MTKTPFSGTTFGPLPLSIPNFHTYLPLAAWVSTFLQLLLMLLSVCKTIMPRSWLDF